MQKISKNIYIFYFKCYTINSAIIVINFFNCLADLVFSTVSVPTYRIVKLICLFARA